MFGNTILSLMGQQDPRQRLLASAMGGARPGAPGATPGGPAGAPGTNPAAAAPPQPVGTSSTPDMLELYSVLQDRSRKENAIDRGITMIAASLAQPENRAALLSGMPQSGGEDNMGLIQSAMSLQEQQQSIADRAEAIQQARGMAASLGISEDEAAFLAQNGSLDDLLLNSKEAKDPAKRGTMLVENSDGSKKLIYSDTGEDVATVTGPKPPSAAERRPTQIVENHDGSKKLIYTDTGEDVAVVTGPKPAGPRKTVMVETADGRDIMVYEDTGEEVREIGGPKPAEAPYYRPLTPEEVTQRGLDPQKKFELNTKTGNVEQVGAGDTNINVNTEGGLDKVDQELFKKMDEDLITVSKPAAQGAASLISSVGAARTALEQNGGIITGSVASPWVNEIRKVAAQTFGIDDPATVNTAQYEAAQADVVRTKIQALGAGSAISNTDLQFTAASVGAGGTVPAEALPRILQTMELGSYNQVLLHNRAVDEAIAARGPDVNPNVKRYLEAQKMAVPEISIPSSAIKILKDDPSPENIEYFNETFGEGAAQTLLHIGF